MCACMCVHICVCVWVCVFTCVCMRCYAFYISDIYCTDLDFSWCLTLKHINAYLFIHINTGFFGVHLGEQHMLCYLTFTLLKLVLGHNSKIFKDFLNWEQ